MYSLVLHAAFSQYFNVHLNVRCRGSVSKGQLGCLVTHLTVRAAMQGLSPQGGACSFGCQLRILAATPAACLF